MNGFRIIGRFTRLSVRHFYCLTLFFLFGCFPVQTNLTPSAEPSAPPAHTSTSVQAPTQSPVAIQPTSTAADVPPTPAPTGTSPGGTGHPLIWRAPNQQLWVLDDQGARPLDLQLEAPVHWYYDSSSVAGRMFHTQPLSFTGAGPGNLTVTDLQIFDFQTRESLVLIPEEAVVKAFLAPDGEHFAYIRATETTYELRWRSLSSGEDRLLASGLAPNLGISPSGRVVAFTRESGYEVAGDPGFYVVFAETGEERKIAELDKAGSGSVDDRFAWSPEETHLLLPVRSSPEAMGILRAAVDGSSAVILSYDSALSEESWYEIPPVTLLWHPDGRHLVGTAETGSFGDTVLVILYELDPTWERIVGGTVLAEARLIGWNQPGSSVWVQRPDNTVESITVNPAP